VQVDWKDSSAPIEIRQLIQSGVVSIFTDESANIRKLSFSTPAAQRVVFNRIFPRSKNVSIGPDSNIDDWLVEVIQEFSKSNLDSFELGSSTRIPKEQALQQEFFSCACLCLPPSVNIVPEMSVLCQNKCTSSHFARSFN
jgi:hypothetical protein